ncbi:MAG: hypothetical protein M5U19_18680 [Microthrixaceae bacterium]|nr:hypothetical protein [Microthrixaceae bacterium]
MARKLGLGGVAVRDGTLLEDLPGVMQADGLDWTLTFRRLADDLRDPAAAAPSAGSAPSDALADWTCRWRAELVGQGVVVDAGSAGDPAGALADGIAAAMDLVNPLYIPRNHVLDAALRSAEHGDLDPLRELTDVLADPFTQRRGLEVFAAPASPEFTARFRTFCGT